MEEIIKTTNEETDKTLEPEKQAPVFDMTKLDKKSLEILEETEEDDYKLTSLLIPVFASNVTIALSLTSKINLAPLDTFT